MRAREIMTRQVFTVTPAVSVSRAAELFASTGYSALPVVDGDGALVGMVTEADLVEDRFPRRAHRHEPVGGDDGRVVREVMTTPTIAMSPATDVGVLAHKMITARYRCIPIVEDGRLVGVVTRHDIIWVLARSDADIAADVRALLDLFGGADRWAVDVHDGVARISDRYDDPADRSVAETLAGSVAGVTTAFVRSDSGDSSRPPAGNPT